MAPIMILSIGCFIYFINHDEFYYFSFLFLLLFVMSAILQMALVVAKQNQNRHKE